MKYIAPLVSLEKLALAETQITDASLPTIRKLPKLRELVLSHTKITSKGMLSLRDLPELRLLRIYQVPLTKEDRAELQRALPKLEIEDH
jgi:Leucine-rich repeat (LRR) protein